MQEWPFSSSYALWDTSNKSLKQDKFKKIMSICVSPLLSLSLPTQIKSNRIVLRNKTSRFRNRNGIEKSADESGVVFVRNRGEGGKKKKIEARRS